MQILSDQQTYDLARAGQLDYAQVASSGMAEWAANGYRERVNDEKLSVEERKFAFDFIQNLDCDWG